MQIGAFLQAILARQKNIEKAQKRAKKAQQRAKKAQKRAILQRRMRHPRLLYPRCREGANHEKLTVKKLIDNEMFFFLSPFMSLTNREKSA